MKIWKLMYLMPIVAIATWLSSCGEDEKDKPKTLAVVETMPVTEFTTTTADVEGEITDDGNLEITESGFVYSNIVSTPTIADSKVTVEAVDGVLSTTLTELASGTLYRVRAYAVNSKGTAYGEVEIFTTGNAAPTASALSITGDVEANKTITASYTYADAEGDAQGTSTFKWYRATSATGTGEAVIDGATSNTYLIKAEDEGKFIKFSFTPKATSGNLMGTEVSSTYVGAVGEATTVTFTYNGNTVTYGIINSTTTGKKWLDRNLGASAVPASVNDYQNYGDLFQWGRDKDGHQLINRTGPTDADATGVTGFTPYGDPPNYSFSLTDNPGHSKFISCPDKCFYILKRGMWSKPAAWSKNINSIFKAGSSFNENCLRLF